MKKWTYGFLSIICSLMLVFYYPLYAQNQKASEQSVTVGTMIPAGTATAAAQAFTGTEGNNLPPAVIINYIIKL